MPSPFFVDCSDLLLDNTPQMHYGAAVADLDGDGEFEIYVTGFGVPSLVLKWMGKSFTNIADTVLDNAGRRAIGVAAGDLDGDGLEELYVLNTDTFGGRKRVADSLFKRLEGLWIDLFALPENHATRNMFAGRSVGCIDRLGVGTYGFFVANYGGPMRLYELIRESLELIDAAPELGLNPVTGGRAVLPAPIISDRTDIFLNNENGSNYLFVYNGAGAYDEIAVRAGVDDPGEHGRGVAAFDANGDGRLDLVYGNWEGPHRLFIQRTDRTFTEVAPAEMSEPSPIRTVIAADFDNDGYDEIFFNNIVEPNRLFGWRGNRWALLDIGDALEPFGSGTGAIVGDFDRTGQLKLLICHGESIAQPLSYYAPQPNGNNWLRILPLTSHGAPARGALVRIRAAGRTQTKLIDAGSGYLCQMEPVAHFGLGSASEVEFAEIQWPDGNRTPLPQSEIKINTLQTVRAQ